MAFLILQDESVENDGFINDFIYFDEEHIDEFKRIISFYAGRVREIHFERAVKVNQLEKLGILIAKNTKQE